MGKDPGFLSGACPDLKPGSWGPLGGLPKMEAALTQAKEELWGPS